ncbi:MAG TPA: TfoX/Sxy family protein [Thermoplasmata archaeon]|nr:TfoX/Sxy family protein [Thermoplasmata archaeon]
MGYSKPQAERVREILSGTRGLTEKEMFGGLAFLVNGNMCVGVHGEDLIVRVEPDETDGLLKEPGAKPFSLSGRGGMPGWLLVAPSGYRADRALKAWVARGVAHASSLPPKRPTKR